MNKEFYFEQSSDKMMFMPTHHYHPFFEIYFLEHGECKYFIQDQTYSVKEGDILIIPENIIHRTIYSKKCSRTLMNFSGFYVPSLVAENLPAMLYLYRNHDILDEFKEIIEKIKREYTSPDLYSEQAIRGLVNSIFFLLARNENTAKARSANSVFVAEAVKQILNSAFGETNLTLSSVANGLSVSPEHLSRTFKKETGFGFNEYITLIRLQKAESMLISDTEKTISEIAFSCGFNDSNYFSDKFKKAYGMSPLKYRKSK